MLQTKNPEFLKSAPHQTFFQLMNQLDIHFYQSAEKSFQRKRIRLRPANSFRFPPGSVAGLAYDEKERLVLELNFGGLYGVSSPLPYYFTEPILQDQEQWKPFRHLLDIFSHRIYELYYEAWKKNHHVAQNGLQDHSRLGRMLSAFSGVRSESDNILERRKFGFASAFMQRSRPASALARWIRYSLGLHRVRVSGLYPERVENPSQTLLGQGFQLGHTTFIGETLQDRAGSMLITIGPESHKVFSDLYEGSAGDSLLRYILKSYLKTPLRCRVKVIQDIADLDESTIQPLGNFAAGHNAWLGRSIRQPHIREWVIRPEQIILHTPGIF